MKTLIIPDIHNHISTVNEILNQEYDKAIFLGDYFDSFYDTTADAGKTAIWLKDSLTNPRHIHLMGNHDMSYRFPKNSQIRCAGFTLNKLNVISKILSDDDWSKIGLIHFEDHYMFSHAGLTEKLAPMQPFFGLDVKAVKQKEADVLTSCKFTADPWVKHYGVTWVRPDEFEIIPEFTQVVGHNPIKYVNGLFGRDPKDHSPVSIESDNGGKIWYMDCLPHYYGVLIDGELSFVKRDV